MQSTATSVDEYVSALSADRQKPIAELRKIIKKNLPKGFKECMAYGMMGYVVPLSTYPAGYHCNPKLPLGFMNLASQKNAIVLHHLGVYGNDKLSKWFADEYAKLNIGKLDMGKGCIRFKNMEKIPYKLIGELCTKITVDEWIAWYEKAIKR
ncbi:MAG: DUF1801 domain-containing protein [Ferruginibacter sp.]